MCVFNDSLTLIFKQQDLHPVQREGLSEAVGHRVLLLLEDLSHLEQEEKEVKRGEELGTGEEEVEERKWEGCSGGVSPPGGR